MRKSAAGDVAGTLAPSSMAREPDLVKSRGIELEKDAWSRSERAVDVAVNRPLRHRVKIKLSARQSDNAKAKD